MADQRGAEAQSACMGGPRPRGLSVHLRGHVLLFDKRPEPAYGPSIGVRLLLIALLLEGLRLAVARWLIPPVPLWLFIPAQLGLALLSVRFIAGLKLSRIGLYSWREWSLIEKSYFLQLLVIANVIFPALLAAQLRPIMSSPFLPAILGGVFLPYLFYGFYQEVVYRGMVQTELVRRWGAFSGILLGNVLYTFGPLHWYYLPSRPSFAIPMFASIFAIGLFFGVLFRRSGNLWIVAVIHGIGNAYIVGSMGKVS